MRIVAAALTLAVWGCAAWALLITTTNGGATTIPVRARLPLLAADTVAQATPANLVLCNVTHVVDGDTVDVSGCSDAGRIRLILINTPEVSPGQCFGKESSAYTESHLLGRQVGLEKDVSETDSFGRKLRYVWTNAELYNERIVRDGFAEIALYPPDLKYQARVASAQVDAQSAGRGLWSICGSVGLPGTATPVHSPTGSPTAGGGASTTATLAPTPPTSCTSASAAITSLDKVLEVVTVSGSGNLTGWYLISTKGNQRFDFPSGFVLNGSVGILSGTPSFANSASRLWWSVATQWNNSEDDDAVLYDCVGQPVSYFDDGL